VHVDALPMLAATLLPSLPSLLVLLLGVVASAVSARRWRPPLAALLGALGFGLAFLLRIGGILVSVLPSVMTRDGADIASIGRSIALYSTVLQLLSAVAYAVLVAAVVLPDRTRRP
jgi:hypothetical protein